MTRSIRVTVNGERSDVQVTVDRRLLDLLREDLGLTGTKDSCAIGVCGACTVLLDGEMIASCLQLAVLTDGREITTIEGLAHDGTLDPIQRAFIDTGGFQCGICTPGQIMATKALLDEIPSPSEAQVREWMTGNLCRCTGYYKIIEAVLAAALSHEPDETGAHL